VPVVPARRELRAAGVDLRATLRPLGIYGVDPTHRWWSDGFSKAVLTPDGPGSMRLRWSASGDVVAEAWGPGTSWLLETAPRWIGAADDPTGFDPSLHPRVDQWWRRHGRFRLAAAGTVWQELVLVVLGQRVTTEEAAAQYARLCHRHGEPAPGPDGLRLPPTPAATAGLTQVDLHRLGVERRRAETLLRAARRADRLEEAATMEASDAVARLSAVPGLGVWTATSTVVTVLGDSDTVVLRDDGLPTLVNYAFTGDGRRLRPDDGGDATMLAHLAPWVGHRGRVVRLLQVAGVRAPRRAPRGVSPDIRHL
jgi:3-methyladenine DNA glycosylase/8-oxoguanine DNA glycosylase